ncbi:unnamed protein product [Cyprideis torosa]|uniref:Uncharacterized protein n=1 Tax=Cyprideis torosa TaxID=163714 RepID=A0A7R8W5X0_9CRUS|nr:unnamed protein product [Cyprideis torosa]CAG0880329.1 unnamed protein product [Cyprideis torosa]
MVSPVFLCLCVSVLVCAVQTVDPLSGRDDDPDATTYDLRMPNAHADKEDDYICTSHVLRNEETLWVTRFEALATADVVHHMLLYVCNNSRKNGTKWDCGHHGVCETKSIVFAWAKNAPPTALPEGVGFKLEPHARFALQIHYAIKMQPGQTDNSGLRLHLTRREPKYLAGIALLLSGTIAIPPRQQVHHVDISCLSHSPQPIRLFGFRTHAHKLGVVITGYKYNLQSKTFTEIARGNPQWPQAFYKTKEYFKVDPTDVLVARCTYQSVNQTEYTFVGMTHNDEMCNLYLMYYTLPEEGLSYFRCADQEFPLHQPLPADSDMPLPRNATLEEHAKHAHQEENARGEETALQDSNAHHHETHVDEKGTAHHQKETAHHTENALVKGNAHQEAAQELDADEEEESVTLPPKQKRPSGGDWSGTKKRPGVTMDSDVEQERNLLGMYYQNPLFDDKTYFAGGAADPYYSYYDGLAYPEEEGAPPQDKEGRALGGDAGGYVALSSWPTMRRRLGQVVAVSADSEGNIVFFHRADRVWNAGSFNLLNHRLTSAEKRKGLIQTDTVVRVTADTGQVLSSWGKDLFRLPHGLTVAPDDSIFVTDVGLHQVMKFDKGSEISKPSLVLGEAMEPGSDRSHFCKPTAVAVLDSGEFFVADGYCNSRVIKFSSTGQWLTSVGSESNAFDRFIRRGPSSHLKFNIPHALALDPLRNLLFVADRQNGRIQVLSTGNLSFVGSITSRQLGPRVFSVAVAPRQGLVFAVNGAAPYAQVPVQGVAISLASNTVVTTFNYPSPQPLKAPHDLYVGPDAREIYVVETDPPRIVKFVSATQRAAYVTTRDSAPPKEKEPPQREERQPPQTKKEAPHAEPQKGDKQEAAILSMPVLKDARVTMGLVILSIVTVPALVIMVVVFILRANPRGRMHSVYAGLSTSDTSSRLLKKNGFQVLKTDESDDGDSGSESDTEVFNRSLTKV